MNDNLKDEMELIDGRTEGLMDRLVDNGLMD